MSTGFDDELLFDELNDILDIDMTDFGFDIDKIDLFKENERHKTNDAYNLDLIDFENSTNDFWQMPVIQNDNFIPNDIIGFNYAKTSKYKNVGIHFYLDDYQFERIWNKPEDYIDILKQYECIFSPDFSLYLDMPMPMKIWNIYRSRQTAFEAINENYKASKEEQNVIKEIRLIKDDDGTQRLYYQGANETVTDFSKSAINGVKKWMANSYVKRKR